jgi:hypothetical protein
MVRMQRIRWIHLLVLLQLLTLRFPFSPCDEQFQEMLAIWLMHFINAGDCIGSEIVFAVTF